MSDDIVDRLRKSYPTAGFLQHRRLMMTAADEIERLREYRAHHAELMEANDGLGKEVVRLRDGIRRYLTSDEIVTSKDLWALIEDGDQ